MLVFSSVTGRISPELYDLVPGSDTSDKATFISLLVKAPYPELARASVKVSTAPDEEGVVVVHGEWTHVAKIQELLQTWMDEYSTAYGESTPTKVHSVIIGNANDNVNANETVGPTVSHSVGDHEANDSSIADNAHPISGEEISEASEVYIKLEDGMLHDHESPSCENSPEAASPTNHAEADSESGMGNETLTSLPVRIRPKFRRKGRPRKRKALPARRAKAAAKLHNQAILKEETEKTATGSEVENESENSDDDTDNLEDPEETVTTDTFDKTDHTNYEKVDNQELQKKVSWVEGEGYKCTECGRCTASEKNILEHVARMHSEKKFRCKLCTKVYALPKDLQVHMAVHRKKFQCDVCHKMFASRYLMQGHRRRRHENPRKRKAKPKEEADAYACNHCNYVGKKLRHLQDHQQRIHGERKYSCPICNKTYAVSKELKQHMRTHSEQFCCEVCGRILKSRYAMKLHTDIQHKGLPRKQSSKTHLCTLCGLMLPNKTKYVIHQNKEHFNIRPFKCETCGMSFFAKANLKDHFKVHEDKRDYSCEICGKAFKMRQNLKMHLIIHAENRPYKCDVCDKTFTQNAALKRHARIHTGERPFQCHMCTTSFNDYSILTRHMQGIHRIDRYKFDKDKNWVSTMSADKSGENGAVPLVDSVPNETSPLGCYICGNTFSQESQLRTHIESAHENNSNSQTAVNNLNKDLTSTVAYPNAPDETRSLYLPYIPPSHPHDGLSESANKVTSALNTLAQELAIARSSAGMTQQPAPLQQANLTTAPASSQDANSSNPISSPSSELLRANSENPVPLLVLRNSADTLPAGTASEPPINRQWPGSHSQSHSLVYPNATVYPVSPPATTVANFPNQYHQP